MAKVDMADELENDLEQTADTMNNILDATGVKDKVKDSIKDAFKKDKSDSPSKDGESGEGDRSKNDSNNSSNNGENLNNANNTGDSQTPNDTNAPENADSSSANNENNNLNDGENTSNSNNNSNDKNQSTNSSDSNANKLGRTDENTVDPSKSSKLGRTDENTIDPSKSSKLGRTDKNTVDGSNSGSQGANTASGTGTANTSGAGASTGSSGAASTATGAGAAGSGTAVSAKAAKDAKSGKDGKSDGADKGSGSNGDKAGKDAGDSGNGSKQSIADKAADKKAASGSAKAGAEAGSKGAASAGAEAGASAGASAGAAGASAGASAGAGAAGAAAGAGASAGGAAAAAGPAGWALAAVNAINQITNSTDSMAGAAAMVIVVLLLPILVILVGIVFILSAAMILAVLLMNAFQFVFSFLIPDEEEELSEDSTPEERYRVIAKIIRKKVKDDYDEMISEWKDDLSTYKNDEEYNEFGLALEYWGMPTPNLADTNAASTKFKIGTGHNNTVAAMFDGDWAYDQYYYLKKFPRGVKDEDNNYLDGDESYFDYERSLETMGNESNNGSIKNMAYLVAGYNTSRCELPISESGQSWFAQTFKSYYWDITSQTWWEDLKGFIGCEDYFEYSASLKGPYTYERNLQVYEECYWEDVTIEKEFTWNITIDLEPINATYGASDGFISDTTGTVSLKTSPHAIKVYYQDELDYGVAWDDSFELTDAELLTSKYTSGLNDYKLPEDKVIETYTNYYIGNGKTISISELDSSGKSTKTCSFQTWVPTGTIEKDTTGKTYDTTGTETLGSKKYTAITSSSDVAGKNLFKTTTVLDSGTTNAITKPTMSDVTSGADPYYVSISERIEVGEQTTDGTYDSTYQTIETIPCEKFEETIKRTYKGTEFTEGEYKYVYNRSEYKDGKTTFFYDKYKIWDEYIVTSHYWDWTKYRYEYRYEISEYQEKGVNITFSLGTPTSTIVDTAAFNKSTYVDKTIEYDYYYLKASSSAFKNNLFVEIMFEKGNSYYEDLPTEIGIPSFVNADGTRTSAKYLSTEEAEDEGLLDVVPNSTDYDGAKEGGIADWPYYSCVNGYEYECGASGTKLYCYPRPDDSKTYTDAEMETLDEYNTSPDGDFSCGCYDPAVQEEMGEDGEKAAVNKTIKSHMCDIMTFSELIVDENTGDPILDENGNKQYQQVTKVKTVQDRIEELVADFKNIIDGVEAEENAAELGIISNNYGSVYDLTIYTINAVENSFNSVTYSGHSGHCGVTLALGKLGWHGEEARELLKALYEKDMDTVRKYWTETEEYENGDHVDDPFFINDPNEWNSSKDHVTCQCNVSATFRVQLAHLLYSTVGQDVQSKLAGEKMQGIIDKINADYGVTDPASLSWLAILCNRCGWDLFKAEYSSVIEAGLSAGGSLTDIYSAYLAQKGGETGMKDNYYWEMSSYYAYISGTKDQLPATWNQKTAVAVGSIALPNEEDIIYFNQASGWKNYGELEAQYKGSGPTVCAMLGATLIDVSAYGPDMCIDWAFNNGYHDEVNGSTHEIIEGFCAENGLLCEKANNSTDIANALSGGKLVVMLLEGTGTSCGYYYGDEHFILLRGITDDGKILVADPGSLSKSEDQTGFDLSLIWNNRKQDGCTHEHAWIISK